MTIIVGPDMHGLIADLSRAPFRIKPYVRVAVEVGAFNVKRDAVQFASGIGHAPNYPRSISYEVDATATGVGADIGPENDGPQGGLGAILEYGSPTSAPHPHLGPALDREGPKFAEAVGVAGLSAITGAT